MIKVITTRYGQLIAKVDKANNRTTILDAADMEPIAQVQSASKEGVMKAINHIASFLRKKQALTEMGVRLEAGADRLESIDTESVQDAEEEVSTNGNEVQSVQALPPALEARLEGNSDVVVAPAPKRSPGRPKGSGQGKGKRGRKPGQKVRRNPELSW